MSLVGKGDLPRLLVIGARGFLGNFIVDRAASAYEVIRGDRTRVSEDTDVAIDITETIQRTILFLQTYVPMLSFFLPRDL